MFILFMQNGLTAGMQHEQGRRLDRSTARYIYKSKNGKLLVVLTQAQKAKLIFE